MLTEMKRVGDNGALGGSYSIPYLEEKQLAKVFQLI